MEISEKNCILAQIENNGFSISKSVNSQIKLPISATLFCLKC